MPGSVPGLPGLLAFEGVKFCGYVLAGLALKKFRPAITASAVKIGASRTGFGILFGLPLVWLGSFVFAHFNMYSDASLCVAYLFLFLARILIWAVVVHIFSKRLELPKSALWKYASFGALWSCVLDVIGIGLALISPGRIPIC